MPEPEKLTILLADEDALRRDGLAAVLQGTAQFEIVAHCPDGETALDQIRHLRPQIAVVDLNLPKLHGIELVRRVRGEDLGTRIIILSSSTNDEIVREVVRAGADAYLLKNGPARHLVDAIWYVRDGGQYFSPQLKRDGLDRHLLEEPPRYTEYQKATEREEAPAEPEREDRARASFAGGQRGSRAGRGRRPVQRAPDPRRMRDRLREAGDGDSLADRDYEILGMMADGIKPILDRLDEIEGRVVQMETGEEPVPENVRGWLSSQIADTLDDPRGRKRDLSLNRTVGDLEARLPQLIEEAVTTRFHQMADKLQSEIEETHVRTLETFVKNIQVKLVQRVSALETDMSKQAEAMAELRDYSQRTEDNLSRLISGVDKLAQDLPRRLALPQPVVEPPAFEKTQPKPLRRRASNTAAIKRLWLAVAVIVLLAGGYALVRRSAHGGSQTTATAASPGAPNAQAQAQRPAQNADTATKMQAAQEYASRKEYSLAENIYKEVIQSEPNNVDALKELASVLYKDDKIEESAAILDKLPKN